MSEPRKSPSESDLGEDYEPPVDGLVIHHVEFLVKRCAVRATLNGVPIADIRPVDSHIDHFAPPANPFLVGENNLLEVEIAPTLLRDDEPTSWDEAEVEIAVRTYPRGGVVAPGEGAAITTMDFKPELAQRIAEAIEEEEELEAPQTFFHMFDNEQVSFADELVHAEAFEDESAMLDYAEHLRDLFARGDVAGFLEEIQPKCEVWSRAYSQPAQDFSDSIREGLVSEFIAAGPVVDWTRDDVDAMPVAGGRLWWLRRDGGLPLIQTAPDAEGSTMQFEIYAAPREGRLRIVR